MKNKILIILSKINFKSIKTGSQPDAPEHQEGHKEKYLGKLERCSRRGTSEI